MSYHLSPEKGDGTPRCLVAVGLWALPSASFSPLSCIFLISSPSSEHPSCWDLSPLFEVRSHQVPLQPALLHELCVIHCLAGCHPNSAHPSRSLCRALSPLRGVFLSHSYLFMAFCFNLNIEELCVQSQKPEVLQLLNTATDSLFKQGWGKRAYA